MMTKVLVKIFPDVWDCYGNNIPDYAITDCINSCLKALFEENSDKAFEIKKIDCKPVVTERHNNGRGDWISLVYTITYFVKGE